MKNEFTPNALRVLRLKAGIRQADVAARLGLTSSDRISHWEKGQSVPSLGNLFKLARIYHLLPHELYSELWNSTNAGEALGRGPDQD